MSPPALVSSFVQGAPVLSRTGSGCSRNSSRASCQASLAWPPDCVRNCARLSIAMYGAAVRQTPPPGTSSSKGNSIGTDFRGRSSRIFRAGGCQLNSRALQLQQIRHQACCSDSQLCGIGIRLWSSQPKKRKTGRHRCQSSCFGSVEFSSHSGSSNIKTHATLTTEAVASRRINELQRLSSSHRTNQAATSSSQDTRDTDLGTVPISESVEDGDERMAGEVIMRKGVPVFVMLPLDTVWVFEDGGRLVSQLKREQSLDRGLETLRKAGVEGVMVDVWWGLTERSPGEYDFTAYAKLFEKIVGKGLKVQAVMSFHAAGGNVGDTCQVPLPQWVMEIGEANPDIWYTDSNLVRNHECLSLGCDEQPIFHGRTPVQMYFDFISAFSDTFRTLFGDCITEITVGLGPAGELRYPSYPEGDGRWRFPGVGEFQCYDKYMLADLKQAAEAIGKPEWGLGGPHDAGHYNSKAWETGFFNSDTGNWNTPYGHFFLSWYSGALIKHADRILSAANAAITRPGMKRVLASTKLAEDGHMVYEFQPACCLGAKLAGVHWWFKSACHAAELTAGYYNTRYRCGYHDFMCLAKQHGCRLHFTCVEMRDCEHPHDGRCSPEGLLAQMIEAADLMDVPLAGENALQRYDYHAFQRITHSAFGQSASAGRLVQVTFLRMGDLMFDNWAAFLSFLNSMSGDQYPYY